MKLNKVISRITLACLLAFFSLHCLAAKVEKPALGERHENVSMSFREAKIEEVFELISRKDKVNIILGKGVTGSVSVNLYDLTVKQAIYQVAEAAGYAVEQRDGNFIVLDKKDVGLDHAQGLMQVRTFKVLYSDPKQVADILVKHLSRYGKATALNDRKMIVVEDTPEFMEKAKNILAELDAQPKQILIEAKVLEVRLDDGENYGVDWSKVFGSTGGTGGSFGVNGLSSGNVISGPRQAGVFFSIMNRNLDIFLEAQTTRNRVRTLSTPKLLALENQEARVSIGDSTGYKVTTTINQVTTESIQFLESGVILRVTPSVDQQGRVLLKVHPEVSSATLSAGIPSKKSTEVTTELLSEDGQAIFIGGLIKKTSSNDKTGVPILGDIPGLGRLFSTARESINTTETVVILTPRIIRDIRDPGSSNAEKVDLIEKTSKLILERQLKLAPSSSFE